MIANNANNANNNNANNAIATAFVEKTGEKYEGLNIPKNFLGRLVSIKNILAKEKAKGLPGLRVVGYVSPCSEKNQPRVGWFFSNMQNCLNLTKDGFFTPRCTISPYQMVGGTWKPVGGDEGKADTPSGSKLFLTRTQQGAQCVAFDVTGAKYSARISDSMFYLVSDKVERPQSKPVTNKPVTSKPTGGKLTINKQTADNMVALMKLLQQALSDMVGEKTGSQNDPNEPALEGAFLGALEGALEEQLADDDLQEDSLASDEDGFFE